MPRWVGDPIWLEDVLRPALGDRLKTLPGWKTSGHGDFADIRGIMCLEAGAVVLTRRGLIPIASVVVGDEVWTHRQRWRPVTATQQLPPSPVLRMRAQGVDIRCTPDHPWLDGDTRWTRAEAVETLRHGQPLVEEDAPGFNEGQAHVIGAWLADGTVLPADGRKNYHPRLSITPRISKAPKVIEWLNDSGVHWYECAQNQGTAVLHINDRDFVGLVLREFGQGSDGKRFPAWVFSDLKIGQAILNGYLHGDGWYGRCGTKGKPYWMINTVSRSLAYGTVMLARMLGRHAYLASRRDAHPNSFGKREVFTVKITESECNEGDWTVPVKMRSDAGAMPTYDITVADDHSFLVDGIWSHNCHHTGNSRESAESIRKGRPDLAGPLSNLHIAPDGTVTIVAVGVCWHAGRGSISWIPTDNANQHTIGIECAWPDIRPDGSYDPQQRWPDKQIISMRDTCAALALKLGVPPSRVIGHKEWAGKAQGKWDPGNLDMAWFRDEVRKDMDGFVFPGEHPPISTPPPPKRFPVDWSDRELLEHIAAKLGAP